MLIKELINRYKQSKVNYDNCKFWLVQTLRQHPDFANAELYLDSLEFREEGIYYKGRRYIDPMRDAEPYELFYRYEDFGEVDDV